MFLSQARVPDHRQPEVWADPPRGLPGCAQTAVHHRLQGELQECSPPEVSPDPRAEVQSQPQVMCDLNYNTHLHSNQALKVSYLQCFLS